MSAETNISEIIFTRISHDLAGNLGVLANGVEVFDEEDNNDNDFLDEFKSILKLSSQTLNARLKFFRMVFGTPVSSLEDNNLVYQTALEYLKVQNIKNPIELETNHSISTKNREILLSIMGLADIVIRGGKIITNQQEDKINISITSPNPLSATRIQTIKEIMAGNTNISNPSLFAPFIYLLSINANVDIHQIDEYSVTISIN